MPFADIFRITHLELDGYHRVFAQVTVIKSPSEKCSHTLVNALWIALEPVKEFPQDHRRNVGQLKDIEFFDEFIQPIELRLNRYS